MRHSVGRHHRGHSDEEIAEAFSEAASQALLCCRSADEGAVYTWMWRAMNSLLITRTRQLAREVPTPDHAELFERPGPDADLQETLDRRAQERQLAALFEALADELAPRQQSVLALHVRDFSKPEQARELKVSCRVVKRDLERVMSRARVRLVARCGGGCEHGTVAVWRYAFGLANTAEAQQAQLHLLDCSKCQAFMERLAWWREAAAAAVPVPAADEFDVGLAEHVLHETADALAQAKQQLADAAGVAKQHAAAGYTRAVEYTPLASVRPGAAATAIAGWLALGSGAAGYCVDRGVNPIGGLVDAIQRPAPSDRDAVAKTPQEPKPAAEQPPDSPVVPAAPLPDPEPPPTPAPAPTPAPPPEPAPTQPPLEPTPPAVQFGEPVGTAAAASIPAAPGPAPAKPAPAQPGVDLYGP